jgi:chromosome segregation ATPase
VRSLLQFPAIISALLCACFSFTACTQSEVLLDKITKQLNEKIGKHEIQIKKAEKMLTRLRDAQRKAKINTSLTAKNSVSFEKEVERAQAAFDELTEKQNRLKDMIAKGAPYKMKIGKDLSETQVKVLTVKVNTKLEIAKTNLKTAKRSLLISKKSNQGNEAANDSLSIKIAQLEGKISILKRNLDQLNDMKEQRKLKSDYEGTDTQDLLREMDKQIDSLESTIDVDLDEFLEDQAKIGSNEATGLSTSDEAVLDDL